LPGPQGGFFSAAARALRRDQLNFYEACARQYGDVVSLRAGPYRIRLIYHPDAIEEMLVTRAREFIKTPGVRRSLRPLLGEGLLLSEGDVWLRQRRLAQPAFHRQRVAGLCRIISERRAGGEDRGDLLSMLVAAQDADDGTRMTPKQLRDEVMTLFLAGHETTANALSWTWYLLAQNPEAEARLHEEVDTVLAGRRPAFEDLPRLRYAEMVLAESMRLYPPAWGLGRRSLRDQTLGGLAVPANALVLMSPYLLQRDPRFYPDPLRFDPQRFTPEAKAARPKFAYFPFGGGARQCIGEPFAWMEGVLILVTLAQRWRFRLEAGARVEPEALITLRPRRGVPMRAESRR